MKTDVRRFAPLGLYLAIAAAVASAGLYIVQREWNLPLQISLGLIVIGLAIFTALDPERTRIALTGRQARYGSNALVLTLAFAGILVVVNYIVYQNPKRWDLTEEKQHTLLSETLDTLKSLPQPVFATAFYPQGVSTDAARQLLDNYKFYGKGKFDYKFVDPDADPVAAKAANVAIGSSGTIVVKMGDRQEKVTSATEQEMTGALVRLMAKKQTIYFLTGHGEYSPDATGDQSYSQAKKTLESKNYTVKTLNLLVDNKIPDDARAIIIAGPRKPISDSEVKLLSDYSAKGGNLIIMEEPTLFTDFGDSPDPLAAYLEKDWGITLDNDVILDTTTQQGFQAIAASYSSTHAITSKLQGMYTAFPTSRSVTAAKQAPNGETLTTLITTGQQSWGETDLAALKANQQPTFDQGKDIAGPVPVAVAGEGGNGKGRVVVIGDSDFAIDVNFTFYGNGDLLINSIDWATQQENLINLTPKQPVNRVLVPPKKYTMNLIFLGSVFVLPGMILVMGVVVWAQRRRRG